MKKENDGAEEIILPEIVALLEAGALEKLCDGWRGCGEGRCNGAKDSAVDAIDILECGACYFDLLRTHSLAYPDRPTVTASAA